MSHIAHRRAWLRQSLAIVAATFCARAAPVRAESTPETPTVLPGGKVVSVDEAKALLDKKAVFIDTRSAVNYGKGHVPGAQAIPYKGSSDNTAGFDASKDQFDLSKLPGDKGTALVFYSDGPTGWKSYKAAVSAVKGGFKSVHYMRGGWAEWQAKGLPAA